MLRSATHNSQESPWLDSAFGGLDLSQFPSLNELPPERSRDDGRFAKHWTDTPFSASASQLRNFVANPDSESLQRVADEIGHEDFVYEVRQRKGEIASQQFKQARPDYLPCDNNLSAMAVTMAYNYLPVSAPTEQLIDRLIDSGRVGRSASHCGLRCTRSRRNYDRFAGASPEQLASQSSNIVMQDLFARIDSHFGTPGRH
jgi:hypothetical protein